MLYAILGRDAPDSLAQRLAVRPAHLERFERPAGGRSLGTGRPAPCHRQP
jgi:uncharacterized protein YciI